MGDARGHLLRGSTWMGGGRRREEAKATGRVGDSQRLADGLLRLDGGAELVGG